MPVSQKTAWERHFETHPPDDPGLIHYLLARVILELQSLSTAFGGELRQRSVAEVAPWLETPEMREQRETASIINRRSAIMDIVRGQE